MPPPPTPAALPCCAHEAPHPPGALTALAPAFTSAQKQGLGLRWMGSWARAATGPHVPTREAPLPVATQHPPRRGPETSYAPYHSLQHK